MDTRRLGYRRVVLIGAHVKTSGGLLSGIERGDEIGAEAIQIFTQSPRMWRPTRHSDDVLERYGEVEAASANVRATFCHATYLINLATAEAELLARSRECLENNLAVGTAIGAGGVVLHVGSHRGSGLDGVLSQIRDAILGALDATEARVGRDATTLLLENAAGTGGTVGRSLEELAAIIEVCSGDHRIGMCLDTQHLFASGVDYSSLEAADAFIDELDRVVGLERLRCLHLNDSKVPLGANRDRHENIGAGEIGADALGGLISSPRLDHVAALLEVPGDGDGPRAEDLAAARAAYEDGRRRRSR